MKMLLMIAGAVLSAGAAHAQVTPQNNVDVNAMVQQLQRSNDQLAAANEQNAQSVKTGGQALAEFGREPDLGRSVPSEISLVPPTRRCASKANTAPTNEWAIIKTPGGGCYLRRKP